MFTSANWLIILQQYIIVSNIDYLLITLNWNSLQGFIIIYVHKNNDRMFAGQLGKTNFL